MSAQLPLLLGTDETKWCTDCKARHPRTAFGSDRVAQVDAPWVNFDATSLAPQLVISNLAPAKVRRFFGDIAAWSGTWKNYEDTGTSTNEIFFHVLIVDPNIQTIVPVAPVWP